MEKLEKKEGAIIDRRERTVRLRHEPPGFFYRLEGEESSGTLEVYRFDQLTDTREAYGYLRRAAGRWLPQKECVTNARKDILNLVARAWTRAPLLRR